MADKEKDEQVDEVREKMAQVDYVYVSSFHMFSNNWDVRFLFGDRQPDNAIVPRVGVVMSHQHAKAMLQVLIKQIKDLEEMFGPIEFGGKLVAQEVDLLQDQESTES